MSTPSGKSFDPNNPSTFAPRRAGEPTAEDDTQRSPYAPKRLRVVHPPEASEEAAMPQFLFEANKPRPPLPSEQRSPNRSTSLTERHPMDLDGLDNPLDPTSRTRPSNDAAPSARDTAPPKSAPPAAPPADESSASDDDDNDIERLEASLRWLKRQDADLRHQRASRPLPPPEPRLTETRERRPLTRAATEKTRAPKPLEPESLMAPALRRQAQQRSSLRGPLMIAIVGLVALPVAYLAVTSFSSPEAPRGARLVAAEPEPQEPASFPQLSLDTNEPRVDPSTTPAEEPPAAKEARTLLATAPATRETIVPRQPAHSAPVAPKPQAAPVAPAATAPAPPPAAPVAAAPPAPAAAAPAAAPAKPEPPAPPAAATAVTRQIDPAEIKILVKQGEAFVAAGDMAAARVVFRRAAEAGDAGAAMALGATYDPLFLTKLSVLGVAPDPEKARVWYQKAKDLGSQEAPRRLELLANR